MFNIQIPKNHFLAASYPYMEDYILGLPIAIGWGNIHNIVPYCVDTDDYRFKILDQHIQDITEIRSKGVPLSAGSFSEDLTVAEFTLAGTPVLTEGLVYYFSISGDYAINGTDYLTPMLATIHAGQQGYYINGANVWTPIAGRQLFFQIFGKLKLDEAEQVILTSWGIPQTGGLLRDVAAHTRIGCSFTCPTAPRGSIWYITKIRAYMVHPCVGSPSGNIWATLFSAISPEVQVGFQGVAFPLSDPDSSYYDLAFAEDNSDSDLLVDIESPYPMLTIAADILEDLFVSILDKDASVLDAAHLAAFAAARYQELKIFIDRDMNLGEFIGKLEASVLFKFIPLQDGTYATVVFGSGEPAGTPHFKDEDFVEGAPFRIEHDLSTVRNLVRVKYDEDPCSQEFKFAEEYSDLARLLYGCEETAEIETWLKEDTDAEDLCETYARFFQEPQTRITFEVHGLGLNLLPGRDKVKITKTRAAWAGGSINAVLFRIMKISKKPATNTSEITAVLDTQTY